MSACRVCGAPIGWVRARKRDGSTSKMIPVDVESDGALALVDNGTLLLTDQCAYGVPLVRVVPVGAGQARPHFATCPDAREHHQ